MSYVVAVRALCEFAARSGDLDLRFTPSPSAQDGIAGHAAVSARRAPGYQAEVSLAGDWGPLHVRGRADGYDPAAGLLEEIKTHRGQLTNMPANQRALHWAQLRVYGHLLCQREQRAQITLALVYFDIGSQAETVLRETASAPELAAQFGALCQRFLAWAEQELAHRAARDAALSALPFPHSAFRPGQRQLSEAVFNANRSGRCLLAQAPTGIGKTVGSLFPVLKAAPAQKIDKVFYLTAKTPGRQLALDALDTLGAPLRTLELVAREQACEHPDKACHGDACPLARGFYDRLPGAREQARQLPVMDRASLRATALAHQVCPYYLAVEMARWSDVVIGDYNYYYDYGAMLHGLSLANQWRVSVLVDEAHNLVARARGMYTAELDRAALRRARALAPPVIKKALERIGRSWAELARARAAPYEVLPALPDKLISTLQAAGSAITDALVEQPAALDPQVQSFYFSVLRFARLAESFGPHSLFDVTRAAAGDTQLCIRNIVPAPFLASRFGAAHASVLFSATLSPAHYYRDALGMPADTVWVDVASPFCAQQLAVHIVDSISTRFQHRARSLAPITDLIARQYLDAPGNYLAFFSSYDYLEQAAALFAERYPHISAWRQARRMLDAERADFLARFTPDSSGIGFAVLGGAFGEGIDLPGARLIGAFIATLGLPQMNPVNEQIRQRMQASFGAGYDYTYLYPGLQKVVQAAGRVIRSERDRGVVYLIDDRYGQPAVQALLPRWWELDAVSRTGT